MSATTKLQLIGIYFPKIHGHDINGRRVNLPVDFGCGFNLVLIAYDRWHQDDVDTWLPLARRLEAEIPEFRVYKLARMQIKSLPMRKQHRKWMSNAISDMLTRSTTITTFTDIATFNQALNVPDEELISVVLADRAGNVYWKERGSCTNAKFLDFQHTLKKLLGKNPEPALTARARIS